MLGEGADVLSEPASQDEDATMRMRMIRPGTLGMLAAMAALPSLGLSEEASLKGMIISHDGATIVVRGGGVDTPVMLTESTKIRGTAGALNVRGDDRAPTDLVRGLPVEVMTVQRGDDLIATAVSFKKEDLRTAQQIAAGLQGTEERIDNVGELTAAGRTKVFFTSGSAVLSAAGEQSLQEIATQAKAIKGYRLVIVGRADPTGNAAANQRLSERRAAAVKAYLLQSCGVLPSSILPAAAVGESTIAQDLDPPGTPQEARRVTVTIAVSKSAQGR